MVKHMFIYKEKNNVSKIVWVILTVSIILQCLVLVYWGNIKEGFHIDEIYSYELANNTEQPFINWNVDFLSQWHENDYFYNSLVVAEENRFNYQQVYLNQMKDVHPPLFYYFLHTICSFFPMTFSKWYGIGLNIFFFILTQIILYLLGENLLQNKWKALIPVILYGFSAGAISSVLYIRMYMMLTFWAVLFVYLLSLLWQDPERKLLYLGRFITMFLGLLTQYYFIIFAFFVSVSYFLAQIARKNLKTTALYVVTIFSAMCANILYYPAILQHIFGGYRGREALSNLVTQKFFTEIIGYLKILNNEVLLSEILILEIIIFLYSVVNKKTQNRGNLNTKKYIKAKKKTTKKKTYKLSKYSVISISFGVSVICYILVISKVAPYIADRYVFCIYPILIFCLLFLFEKILTYSNLQNKKYIHWGSVAILIVMMLINNSITGNVKYLYQGTLDNMDILKKYSKDSAIYLVEQKWKVNNDILFLSNINETYIIGEDDISEILIELAEDCYQEIILYVANDYENIDEKVYAFARAADFPNIEFLFQNGYSKIYRCYR